MECQRIMQGDAFTFQQILQIYNPLTEQTEAIDLTTADNVVIKMVKWGATECTVDAEMSIDDAEGGQVSYDFDAEDTATPGMYYVRYVINYTNGNIRSVPDCGYFFIYIIKAQGD